MLKWKKHKFILINVYLAYFLSNSPNLDLAGEERDVLP